MRPRLRHRWVSCCRASRTLMERGACMEVRGIWEQVGEGFSAVCRLRADVRVFISPRVVIRVFISPRVVIRVVISAWYVNQHIRRSFSSPYRRGSMAARIVSCGIFLVCIRDMKLHFHYVRARCVNPRHNRREAMRAPAHVADVGRYNHAASLGRHPHRPRPSVISHVSTLCKGTFSCPVCPSYADIYTFVGRTCTNSGTFLLLLDLYVCPFSPPDSDYFHHAVHFHAALRC